MLQYISAKYNVEYDELASRVLAPDTQTVEVNDSEVYSVLQTAIPTVPEEDDAYFDKQASILSKSYKKMCMNNNFNFKQPIRAVVDIGCATRCVFTR